MSAPGWTSCSLGSRTKVNWIFSSPWLHLASTWAELTLHRTHGVLWYTKSFIVTATDGVRKQWTRSNTPTSWFHFMASFTKLILLVCVTSSVNVPFHLHSRMINWCMISLIRQYSQPFHLVQKSMKSWYRYLVRPISPPVKDWPSKYRGRGYNS